MKNIKKSQLWIRVKELTIFVYKQTMRPAFEGDDELRKQLQFKVMSILNNVSEAALLDKYDSSYCFRVSRTFAIELLNLAILAEAIDYIDKKSLKHIEFEVVYILVALNKIIKTRGSDLPF